MGKRGKRRGQDSEIERRRWKVAKLLARGFRPEQIAQQLAVCDTTVKRDAQIIRARRIAASIEFDETLAQQEIEKYRAIQQAAWESYEKSCEDAVTVEVTDENGVRKTKTVRKGQAGDAAHLAVIKNAQDKICEILGLIGKQAGVNINLPGGEGGPAGDSQIVRVVIESRDELAQFEAISMSQLKQQNIVAGKVVRDESIPPEEPHVPD